MSALFFLSLSAIVLGLVLTLIAMKYKRKDDPLVTQINHLLPQTQCAQCGYPGCKPYAEAIAKDQAPINLCPPGGQETVIALAELLNKEPLDLAEAPAEVDRVAVIDESRCIGCVLCIKACPVDAIVGAPKLMHTVIANQCTGCDLCVPACPVDCIDMVPRHTPS